MNYAACHDVHHLGPKHNYELMVAFRIGFFLGVEVSPQAEHIEHQFSGGGKLLAIGFCCIKGKMSVNEIEPKGCALAKPPQEEQPPAGTA